MIPMTPEQFQAQRSLAHKLDKLPDPACRKEPRMWEESLPGETGDDRLMRVAYAQWKCEGCPALFECEAVKNSDPSLRGVIAGQHVTTIREKESAA